MANEEKGKHLQDGEREANGAPRRDETKKGNKYFGTDGFRAEAGVGLTSMHAYRIGRFLGWYYSRLPYRANKAERPRIVIGKDTRRSGYMLEYSVVAGLTASGADAYMLHVTTTPGVSYVTHREGFDCGIMITASHNPYYDNGIKIINQNGEKLDDDTASLIEEYIDGKFNTPEMENGDLPLATRDGIGKIIDYVAGRNRYVGYLISLASHSYKHLRIGLDCANGSAWMIADAVFGALGAQRITVGASPDGLNVNDGCGSTHVENLVKLVKERGLDVGFAFDGDADRCIAVDENGKVVDGDAILYVLARRLKERGMLNSDTVVTTVMSNSGLFSSLKKIGIDISTTAVGDRFVYERMQEEDFSLGGEQSGHVILKKYATTGDGILTAIMIAEEMCDKKLPLSKLTDGLKLYPQYTESVRVADRDAVLCDAEVKRAKDAAEAKIGDGGRILLRKSGTEPVIRVMAECDTDCEERVREVVRVIRERGFSI